MARLFVGFEPRFAIRKSPSGVFFTSRRSVYSQLDFQPRIRQLCQDVGRGKRSPAASLDSRFRGRSANKFIPTPNNFPTLQPQALFEFWQICHGKNQLTAHVPASKGWKFGVSTTEKRCGGLSPENCDNTGLGFPQAFK